MTSPSNSLRLTGKVVLAIAAVATAVVLYQGWVNLRPDSVAGLAVVEGRGLIVTAERKLHRELGRIKIVPDWEEICALFRLETASNAFHRCFAPREFTTLKLDTQSRPVIRVWVHDPQCATEPQKTWGMSRPENSRGAACRAEQIEVAGKLVATPGSAPSCSIFGGSCPPREPGAQDWKDIKQFPASVQVGLLRSIDGAPRHYLAYEHGQLSEWVEYRYVGFEKENGSINISRGSAIYASPERAMIDIRALQHEIFVLPGDQYTASTSSGSFRGFAFHLIRVGSRHECVFFAGAVEHEEFGVRGCYCAPKGETLSESIVRRLLESIEVLPPARTRL